MTNKFRQIQEALPQGPDIVRDQRTGEVPTWDRLDGGLNLSIPARLLGPSESPDLLDVRFENGAIRKSFGFRDIGDVAPTPILGISEHRFIDGGQEFSRLIRFRREEGSNQGITEIYDPLTGTWLFDARATTISGGGTPVTVEDNPVSMVSVGLVGQNDPAVYIPGALFIATKTTPILIREETTGFTPRTVAFPAGTLTAEGDSLSSGPLGISAPVIGNELEVEYDISTTFVSGVTQVQINLGFYVNSLAPFGLLKTVSHVFTGTASLTGQKVIITGPADTVIIRVDEVIVTEDPAAILDRESTNPVDIVTGPRPDFFEADRVFTDPALNDSYTYNYGVIVPVGATPATVEFYYDVAGTGTWVLAGTETYTEEAILPNETKTLTIPGLGANSKFGYALVNTGTQPQTFTVWYDDPDPVQWQEPQAVAVDWSFIVDPVDVEWDEDAPGGVVLYQIDAGTASGGFVPAAHWIEAFGDRIIGLRNGGDSQYLGVSADGNGKIWDYSAIPANGAFATLLVDTPRGNDPIDALQSAVQLKSNVLAVFRERSIMRLYETGNIDFPVGIEPWIQSLGTDAPRTAVSTPAGIMFLGHDLMVYLLTEQGPQPVGAPIHQYLINNTDPTGIQIAEGLYDSVQEEYYLAVPVEGSVTNNRFFVLDYRELQVNRQVRWRREVADSVANLTFISNV